MRILARDDAYWRFGGQNRGSDVGCGDFEEPRTVTEYAQAGEQFLSSTVLGIGSPILSPTHRRPTVLMTLLAVGVKLIGTVNP